MDEQSNNELLRQLTDVVRKGDDRQRRLQRGRIMLNNLRPELTEGKTLGGRTLAVSEIHQINSLLEVAIRLTADESNPTALPASMEQRKLMGSKLIRLQDFLLGGPVSADALELMGSVLDAITIMIAMEDA